MERITVALGERSYPIDVGSGALDGLPGVLRSLQTQGPVAIVTDSNVGPLYANRVASLAQQAGLAPVICELPAGEANKQLARIEELCGRFLDAGLDRSSLLLALGGGVTGDIAGFAAACYMRGIRFIQLATTIVAQVDSSVGGKTGVNHPLAKNIIGSFHQPSAVIIDLDLLRTLPPRELRAGLAEVVKHGVIADETLFEYMEQHAAGILAGHLDALQFPIVQSCRIKSAVVSEDEHEHGLRAILNYGHTFGHAIEAVAGYGCFLHGEAVSLGMVCASQMAHAMGMIDATFVTRQQLCLQACGLPVRWPDIPVDACLDAMKHDKKSRAGTLRFILPDRMGHVVQRTGITETQARDAFQALRNAS